MANTKNRIIGNNIGKKKELISRINENKKRLRNLDINRFSKESGISWTCWLAFVFGMLLGGFFVYLFGGCG